MPLVWVYASIFKIIFNSSCMKHWYSHAIVGLMVAILFMLLTLDAPQTTMVGSILALLIGSILPDIDHPSGKLRGMLRYLIFGFVMLMLYFLLTNWGYIRAFTPGTMNSMVSLGVVLFFSYVITVGFEKLIPKHRGPIHRFTAALIYMLFCGVASHSFGIASPETVALAGGLGYLTHLISDMF